MAALLANKRSERHAFFLSGITMLILNTAQAADYNADASKLLGGFNDIRNSHPVVMEQNLQLVKDIMAASSSAERQAAWADGGTYSNSGIVAAAMGKLQGNNGITDAIGGETYNYASGISAAGKDLFAYPRPFVIDPSIIPIVGAGSFSFPSGHSSKGFGQSLIVAYAFPERYQQILTRAAQYAYHRIVLGVHYPLDTIGGRIVGMASLARALSNPNDSGYTSAVIARKAILDACGGNSIAVCAVSGKGTRNPIDDSSAEAEPFGNYANNKAYWTARLTYGLPDVGPADRPMVVPDNAEYLLISRFPYMSHEQLREVLRTTSLPSGGVLDNGEGWARLNLFAATDGYGALDSDTTITMDARRAVDDSQPGAGYNATDVWRNDISGSGILTKAGSGELTLTGDNTFGGLRLSDGTLRLTGINKYAKGVNADGGSLVVENGTLDVQGDIVTLPGSTLILNGGTLGSTGGVLRISGSTVLTGSGEINVGQAQQGIISGLISGPGGIVKAGAGDLSLTGSNSYTGGTHVTAGRLSLGHSSAAGTGTITLDGGTTLGYARDITVFNPLLLNGDVNLAVESGEATQAGSISGGGTYRLTGAGLLNITGDSSDFNGHTDIIQTTVNVTNALGGSISVMDGGTLAANGPLTATVSVGRGGLLKGSGSTGSVRVGDGGTVAPGNSPGTLRVLGNLSMDKGSMYRWETDPVTGYSDLLSVSGKAILSGGQVIHTGEAGSYSPLTTYTILTAAEGVEGQFDSVASDYTFLAPHLGYTPNSVTLQLVRNDVSFASVAQTFNQREIAQAAERATSYGSLYESMVVLNAPQMRGALDSLSGDIHASSATALTENSRYVRDAALDRLHQTYNSGVSAWVRPFKSDGKLSDSLDGNASGIMVGVEGGNEKDFRAGVLAGTGTSSWSSSGGRVSSDDQLFGAYTGGRLGAVALSAGAGYSHHNLDSHRDVSFTGFSGQERAGSKASVMQVFGEAGYVIDADPLTIEPYAGIATVRTRLNDLKESDGEAALNAGGKSYSNTFTTTGLRTSWDLTTGKVNVRPWADVAWRHLLSDSTPERKMAFADGGSGFRVRGAQLTTDAAVAGAGVTLAGLGNQTSLTLGWNGIYGKNGHKENTGNLTLSVAF